MSANETYRTRFFDTEVTMTADWSQSASPIWMSFGDIEPYSIPMQVADYGHNKWRAMRAQIEEYVVEGGDDPADFEAEIDAAIDAMTLVETGDEDA